MTQEKWPALKQMLSSYFHQDWKLEADTEEGLFAAFVSNDGPASARKVVRELERLLGSKLDVEQRRSLLTELGCDYGLPRGHELNTWLAQARDQLQAELSR